MEHLIKSIIDRARAMRTSSKITDYDIAQFVHIELGKVMDYDNNYSAKLESGKDEKELSSTRKSNMLRADTDKSQKAQICTRLFDRVSTNENKNWRSRNG